MWSRFIWMRIGSGGRNVVMNWGFIVVYWVVEHLVASWGLCCIALVLVDSFNWMTVFLCRNFEFLIPDAPELIANFLEGEQDMSCKRNAFLMLLHADQERALAYLASCLDQVTSFGDILQLVIVELIYKVHRV